nr:MAG TPA: hypothetical protein [Caudoviricetes sp.]
MGRFFTRLGEDSHSLRCSKLCTPLRGEQQATQ